MISIERGPEPYKATGYQMIRTIEITNFRGIEDLRVANAGRLNVLVGPNGTGKTAFLEGLFLASGISPELLLRTKRWRGQHMEFAAGSEAVIDAMWAHTFRDPSLGSARIALLGDQGERRVVEISLINTAKVISASGEERPRDTGLEFTWETPKGRERVVPKVTQQGIEIGAVLPSMSTYFIGAQVHPAEVETAQEYSRLRLDGKQKEFEDAFLREFNMLESLSVEAPWGSPAIYARMKSGRTLPLAMISGGVNRLAAMMLRLAANPRCLLLVDEIENGFFHERYGSIWRTLYDLAVKVDGQVFATTHSFECLQALANALPDKGSDIRFMRSRLRDNEVYLEQMSGETLFGALSMGEVR